MKIFWDTNILVDLLLVRRPFYESASTILTMSEENDWQIVISSLSIMNANYICCERGKMPKEMWEQKIFGLSSLVGICRLDSENILNSCFTDWSDFEDCVQYNCAIQNQYNYKVTRNPKDFRLSLIPVFEPDDFISMNQIGNIVGFNQDIEEYQNHAAIVIFTYSEASILQILKNIHNMGINRHRLFNGSSDISSDRL